jgi:WD40 repeat protein
MNYAFVERHSLVQCFSCAPFTMNSLFNSWNEDVHKSAITSVQFHPTDASKVLTNGMDSLIKIVDVRTCKAIHEFSHKDFQTSYSWSSSVFSPDGKNRTLPFFLSIYMAALLCSRVV